MAFINLILAARFGYFRVGLLVAGLFYLFDQFLIKYLSKRSLLAVFSGIASDATGPQFLAIQKNKIGELP